jgi:hypothetical protein
MLKLMQDAPEWLARLFRPEDRRRWYHHWNEEFRRRGVVEPAELLPVFGDDPVRVTAIQADPKEGALRIAGVEWERDGNAAIALALDLLLVELDTPGGG